MAPWGSLWGSSCVVVTLCAIETICTNFGQNPGFSLRNSVSLTPGPTVKRPTRVLNRDSVNKRGLDLSKEVLWASIGQRAAELQSVKVGGQKKFCRAARFEPASPAPGPSAEFFDNLQLWQPAALVPFDPQRPTPTWKSLYVFLSGYVEKHFVGPF